MKKIIYAFALAATVLSCKSTQTGTGKGQEPIVATLDLVNVQNDRVMVTIDPARITKEQLDFYIPKTVPGTYSIDNYGQFIEDVKAYDYDGNEITISKNDQNSWSITNPEQFDKLTYWVNDTFDIPGEEGVFSPAGTNIEKGENFMLNLHGFVGYFEGMDQSPYKLVIQRPENMVGGTALNMVDSEKTEGNYTRDVYAASRYFEITDHPIMYSAPDTTSFNVQGMKVLIDVYSPNNVYSSEAIKPGIEEMITAQKRFMGDINSTDKYSILLYLADMQKNDAKGFGALEHHTSTTVVLPETMDANTLSQTMTDVVSHEFFHIITPLSIHSEEIHYFDYNDPEMSQHLWMYEGVTEYFANLFQVNQGLIDNNDFYGRISEKIKTAENFDDTVSFTVMSENILEDPYKDMYYNVYQKGALIGMALDIRLRELSNGKNGILHLMKHLSNKYGQENPFKDEELVPAIVSATYPEIQEFFNKHVIGTTPIPYEDYLEKVGVEFHEEQMEVTTFIYGQTPYIDANQEDGSVFFRSNVPLNSFLEDLGVQGGDVIKNVNGTTYNLQNIYGLITASQNWEKGEEVTFVIERDGQEMTLSGQYTTPMAKRISLQEMNLPENDPRVELREAWLKG